MQFGIYTSVDNSQAVKAAGWDYVEENVQAFLQGTVSDAEWKGAERASYAVLPVPAANRHCYVCGIRWEVDELDIDSRTA